MLCDACAPGELYIVNRVLLACARSGLRGLWHLALRKRLRQRILCVATLLQLAHALRIPVFEVSSVEEAGDDLSGGLRRIFLSLALQVVEARRALFVESGQLKFVLLS